MPDESTTHSITVITDLEVDDAGSKGFWDRTSTRLTTISTVDTDRLAASLTQFCQNIGGALAGVTTTFEAYELEKFELTLDVTAKGEVRLICGMGTEFRGGIKLAFSKVKEGAQRVP